jgi:hypothetical protein
MTRPGPDPIHPHPLPGRVLRSRTRVHACGLALLTLALTLPACSSPRRTSEANDKLRKENLELRRQVDDLQAKADLRVAEIDRLQKQVNHPQPAVEGAVAPQLTKITFDRLTGPVDTNSDHKDDTVRVYLRTLDQQGRFLPVAGVAKVQVTGVAPGRDPVVLVDKTFDPKAFDAAYRSGLTGTHYTLELPLPQPLPDGVRSVMIIAHLTDTLTRSTFTAERASPLQP